MDPVQQDAFFRAFVPCYSPEEGQPFYFFLDSKNLFQNFVTFLENSKESEAAARLVEYLEVRGENWRANEQDVMRLARYLPKMVNLSTLILETPGFHHPVIIATLHTSELSSLATLHLKMDGLDTKYISILRGVVPRPGSLKDVRFLSDKDGCAGPEVPEDYPQEYIDAVMQLLAASAKTIETLIVRSLPMTKAFARTRVMLQFPNLSVLKTFGHWFKQSPSLAQRHPKVTHLEFWVPDRIREPGCSCGCDGELLHLLGLYFPALKELAFEALNWPCSYEERLKYLFTIFFQQTKYLERATLSLVPLDVASGPHVEQQLHASEQAALMSWDPPLQLPLIDVAFSPEAHGHYLHVFQRDNLGQWKPQNVEMIWPNNSDTTESCRAVLRRTQLGL